MEGSTEGSKECIFIFVFSYPHSTHSTPVQNIAPRNPPASPPILRFLFKNSSPFLLFHFPVPKNRASGFFIFSLHPAAKHCKIREISKKEGCS